MLDEQTKSTLLDDVRRAKRLTVKEYDTEFARLIEAALLDLQGVGIITKSMDALIRQAVVTYCLANFGTPPNYADLKASYDEQKGQLMSRTGYTEWGDGVGEG